MDSAGLVVRFVDKARRTLDGQIFDIIDYTFEVSRAGEQCMVNVGITGGWHDEIADLHRKLTREELVEAARKWLESRINKGYDPLLAPSPERVMTIPSGVMDFYVNHWNIPDYV